MNRVALLGLVLGILLMGCTSKSTINNLIHIHGLGYTQDGMQILIPAHDGFAVYENGKWRAGQGEKRDYMGFATVDTGFYSSGHPAEGSNERNPLGIVKSADYGKTIQILDLYGVEDFHVMGVSYKSHAIYVFNPKANAKMPAKGLFYSFDDAKTWTQGNMSGVSGEPLAIAVHPTDQSSVALLSKNGLFVSKDMGNHFDKWSMPFQATTIAYGMRGELVVGGQGAIVIQGVQTNTLNIPQLDQGDAIQYVAQSPAKPEEMVFSTYKMNVYISRDQGASWTMLAMAGKLQ